MPISRSPTGSTPSVPAAGSCCASTIRIASARRPNSPRASRRISAGWVSPGTSWRASPIAWTAMPTAAERLKASGRLYACYETPEELSLKRKLQLQRGAPPVYDRAALALSTAEKAKLEAEGRQPYWRFKLSGGRSAWSDLVRGPQDIDEASQSDPVLVRANGSYLYTFTSVVDDIAFAISHVIRGADHVTNTGAQIELYRALGGRAAGIRPSAAADRRHGRRALQAHWAACRSADLRDEGIEPLALASYLATVGAGGTGAADQPRGPGRRFRPRALRRRLAALRSGGALASERPAAAPVLLRRGGRPPAARDQRAALAGGARQYPAPRRCRDLAPDLRRAGGAGDRMPRIRRRRPRSCCPRSPGTRAPGAAGPPPCKQVTGHSGRGLFHPLRLALTGAGGWTGAQASATDHGPRPGARPAAGRNRLRPRRLGMAKEMRSCCREI